MEKQERELSEYRTKAEHLARENASIKKELARFEAEFQLNSEKLDHHAPRTAELEARLLEQERNANDKIQRLTSEKNMAEANSRTLQGQLSDMRFSLDNERREKSNISNELTTLKSKYNTTMREKQQFIEELTRLRKKYDTHINTYSEDYATRVRELEEQLQDSLRREKATRDKSLELLRNHERVEEKLKHELESSMRHYEKQITELQNENKYLSKRIRELQEGTRFH
eukprot:TRINITY_DN3289_c0_g1_i10.p1 TRINITY_DN3289_c0_g1~~TRINITY_DN3289_c0_g1_i10.p1  ORF type:complete len:228 (+),score=40.98 TRINITY_DN3289_c0_g1_i10:135-818(+)